MTNEDTMHDFIDRYAAAWASADPLAMKAVWHEEGILYHPILSEPITGTWVPANNHRTKTVVPGFKWSLIRWASAGETLFIEWKNEADLGSGPVSWTGVDRMCVVDGKVTEEVVYVDTFPLRAMIDENIHYTPMVDVSELKEFRHHEQGY